MSEVNQMDKENLSSLEHESMNNLNNNESNDTDEERNYWQKLVDKIYTTENHAISIDLFNGVLAKIKIW